MQYSAANPVILARLQQLEPLYRKARRADIVRLVLYALLALIGIPVVFGGALGGVWLMGNYGSQHPAAVIATGLGLLILGGWLAYVTGCAIWRIGGDAAVACRMAFLESVLLPSLQEVVPGGRATGDSFDPDKVRASQLFRTNWDTFESPCTVYGVCRGIAYAFAPLRIQRIRDHANRQALKPILFFQGYLLHIVLPYPVDGALRMVDPIYDGGDLSQCVQRWPGTVRHSTGDEAFDSRFWIVLNEDSVTPVDCPLSVRAEFLAIAAGMDLPLFLAMNKAGIFLAIYTPDSRIPLECPVPNEKGAGQLTSELLTASKIPQIVERLLQVVHPGASPG